MAKKAQKSEDSKSRLDIDKGVRPSEIADSEAWRLVNETGLLSKIPRKEPPPEQPQEPITLGEEIMDSALLIIPFSFLFLLMEILVHMQYNQEISYSDLGERMLTGIPVLAVFIFYTIRHKQHRATQLLFLILSLLVGPRMVWLVNKGSWLTNMKQCPPVAVLWVYSIVQLDLGLSVVSLVLVGLWGWWTGMKLNP